MRSWARTVATVVLAVAFLAPGGMAVAQDAIPSPEQEVVHSWALSPAGSSDPNAAGNRNTFSYASAPGATIDDGLTIYNYSNVPLAFELYATDAFNNSSGEFDVLPGSEDPVDVGTWVTLPTPSLIVPADSQATMPITVTIPRDAAPGDHAGAIVASSTAQGTGPDGKIVDLDRRTGSRIYIRVDGDLNPELAVESVETKYEPALNPLAGTAEITYKIRNRGNVRLAGEHGVSIAGPFGLGKKTSATETLTELLPGEEVEFTVELDGVPAGVLDTATVRVEPSTLDGSDEELGAVSRSSLALALPVSVILLALVTALAVYARRQYRKHGEAAQLQPQARPAPGPRHS